MVRLLRTKPCCVAKSGSGFNPTMVRLLPNTTLGRLRISACVSIPQWCDCCRNHLPDHIMQTDVSIPQWCDCCLTERMSSGTMSLFQSHNGAIAAIFLPSTIKAAQRVSIPQWCDCCSWVGIDESSSGWFQSHNGAIAADLRCDHFDPNLLVSIPQWCDCCHVGKHLQRLIVLVSIPQWCDCCRCSFTGFRRTWQRFNPTMVRLLLFLLVSV